MNSPRPTRTLPPAYHSIGRMDITNDTRLLLQMNLWGTLLSVLFLGLFAATVAILRPGELAGAFHVDVSGWVGLLRVVSLIVAVTVLMIVMHEGIHGIFFWIFTGARPVFTFKIYYASASAPGWYLPRRPFLITTLAPFVLITLAGCAGFAIVPVHWILPLLLMITFNASGAVGDLMVARWLLRQPDTCLVYDEGHAVTFYLPENETVH